MSQTGNIEIEETSINLIILNRPDNRNAFSEQMIMELIEVLERWKINKAGRPLIIIGKGRSAKARQTCRACWRILLGTSTGVFTQA